MRAFVLLATSAACSSPGAHDTPPVATAPAEPRAVASTNTSSSAPIPAALDPATLHFVDVPALHPPAGARLMIGLNAAFAEAALSPAGDVVAIAGGMNGVQLIHVPTARGLASRSDLACVEPDRGAGDARDGDLGDLRQLFFLGELNLHKSSDQNKKGFNEKEWDEMATLLREVPRPVAVEDRQALLR